MPDTVKLLSAIDAFEAQSIGSEADGGELATHRALALDAYSGKNIEPAPEGRSQVVDFTIFETIQWILPALTRIFAGGDSVVEFEPVGPEDEDAAEQESEYLNYLVTTKNNWFLTCLTWFSDALLTKNAYCLAFMEERRHIEIERYEGQTEEQVTLLLEDEPEILGQKQYDDPKDEGVVVDPMTGEVIDPADEATMMGAMALYADQGMEPVRQYKQLYDIELRHTRKKKQLQFKVLPPERVKVGSDTPDFTLDDCNFFEYCDLTTISELRKDGFEVDDHISDDGYRETEEDYARGETYSEDVDIDTPDPSMRQVTKRHIWIRHDYDEDGIAELQYVILVGREVLYREEVSRIPVACIVPFINTHRHLGTSVADLTFPIQRIKTNMLRSGLDSLNLSINPGHQVSDRVNLDDMMVSRPGRLVRLKNGAIPGEGHVMPLQTEFVLPQAQAGMQYMDTITEARVGVTRQFQGIDASANNDYNRIGQLSTMASQRVEQIARIFANGVERLFSLAHELIIKAGHQGESIKLRGQWVTLDPTQWRTGRDMRVVAPFSAGNKDSLVQRIMLHMQVHEKALQGGLPIVDANNAYNLAQELARATDLAGNKLYTDPDTIQPPPPPPDYTAIALEIENKKVDTEAEDEARQAEIDRYKADLDAQVKELTARIHAETQIYLAQAKAGQQVDLEQVKARLRDAPIEIGNKAIIDTGDAVQRLNQQVAASIAQITAAVAELKDTAEAPREVVRDDKGRVVGVKVNGRVQSVQRDSDGNITGLQ